MKESKLFELYREMYLFELHHRDSINSGLGTAIGVAALVGGGLLYLIREHLYFGVGLSYYIYYATLTFAAATFCLSLYHLAHAWFGRVYSYLLPPDEIEAWRVEQAEYHRLHPNETPGLDERLQLELLRQISEVTTDNRTCNKTKSQFTFLGRLWMIVTVALLGVALIPLAVLTL